MNIRAYIHRLVDDYNGHTSTTGASGTLYIRRLADEYMGPRVRSTSRPRPGIFVDA
jgi:hypothetical protein